MGCHEGCGSSNEGHEGDEEEGSDEAPRHEGSSSSSSNEGHEGNEEEGSHEACHEGSCSHEGHEGDEEEGSHEAPRHEGSSRTDEGHEGHEGHEVNMLLDLCSRVHTFERFGCVEHYR